ncbi:WXG100 family type VII secretion target [Nocardia sp. NPDC058480]|uniref:WXG100 family type VII secretion target n=1 Tax=Nocardia sp. NPDC058480 TaxID=3346522 RepID=UPI00364AD3C7
MSEEFSVDLDELDQIVTRLSALSGFLSDQVNALDAGLAKVSAGSWVGVAAGAYADAQRDLGKSAREFSTSISGLADRVKYARQQYEDAATVNIDMFRGA